MTSCPPCPGDVTVVITTYNHAHFLEGAIASALAQTTPPDGIIVVDDGSDDHPEDIMARFPSVRLIRQPNAGLGAARNTGWRAATSEFIVFLDADDRLLPDAVRLNLARLLAQPEAAFAYGAYVNVDAMAGRRYPVPFRPVIGDSFVALLRHNLIGMHATVMYRRTRLEAVGGFEPGLPACEDYDIYLRMACRFSIVCGPEPIAEYWHHGRNMSRNSAMMLRAALSVLRLQKQSARRLDAMRAYREGVTGWKRYYVTVWFGDLIRAVRARTIAPSLVRQGFSLATMAPLAFMLASFDRIHRIGQWLVGRAGIGLV